MKPVFSTDNTLGRKNSVFHADKFAKGNLSESTEEKLCDAEMKKLDFRLEEKIPRKNKLINDFTLVAMFALFGIMTLIGSTKGEELLFKLSPIFIVALVVGYGVMIWNKKCIRNLKPEENKSEEELEAERSYDSMVRVALDELMFPYDAYLADSIGNWEGNGIGDTRQWSAPIHLETLKQDSIRELRITHIMQDNPLKGIEHVGIRIKEIT